jgi:hypothetical protein
MEIENHCGIRRVSRSVFAVPMELIKWSIIDIINHDLMDHRDSD